MPLGRVRYSVPSRLFDHWVWMRVTARTVEILHGDERVASHARLAGPAAGPLTYVTCPDYLQERYRFREEWADERLLARASAIGDGARRFVEAVLGAGRHPVQAARTCVGTLGLTRRFERGRVDAACRRALEIDGLSYRSVQSILKCDLDRAAPARAMPKAKGKIFDLRPRPPRFAAYHGRCLDAAAPMRGNGVHGWTNALERVVEYTGISNQYGFM